MRSRTLGLIILLSRTLESKWISTVSYARIGMKCLLSHTLDIFLSCNNLACSPYLLKFHLRLTYELSIGVLLIRYSLLFSLYLLPFYFPLYPFLISSCFHFPCFILCFNSLKVFNLAYGEYLYADNANIYLLTPQRTIAGITRWHSNVLIQVLLGENAINYC